MNSASDYTPFGMEMTGRTYTSSNYRYGFNGMEKDDEMKGSGNSYDFGARVYDSRLGTWLSVDPLASSRTGWTPYNFCRENPILNIDPTGALDTEYKDKDGGTLAVTDDGVNRTVTIPDVNRTLFDKYMKLGEEKKVVDTKSFNDIIIKHLGTGVEYPPTPTNPMPIKQGDGSSAMEQGNEGPMKKGESELSEVNLNLRLGGSFVSQTGSIGPSYSIPVGDGGQNYWGFAVEGGYRVKYSPELKFDISESLDVGLVYTNKTKSRPPAGFSAKGTGKASFINNMGYTFIRLDVDYATGNRTYRGGVRFPARTGWQIQTTVGGKLSYKWLPLTPPATEKK